MAAGFFTAASFVGFLPVIGISISFWLLATLRGFLAGFDPFAGSVPPLLLRSAISRGVDNREVRADRIRKSVAAENTFSTDLTDFDAMVVELEPLIDKVWRYCEGAGNRGRTVTLKMKFNDFEIITRSRSVPVAVSSRSDLQRLSVALLQNEMPVPKPVRLLGVSLSALQHAYDTEPQLALPM